MKTSTCCFGTIATWFDRHFIQTQSEYKKTEVEKAFVRGFNSLLEKKDEMVFNNGKRLKISN